MNTIITEEETIKILKKIPWDDMYYIICDFNKTNNFDMSNATKELKEEFFKILKDNGYTLHDIIFCLLNHN